MTKKTKGSPIAGTTISEFYIRNKRNGKLRKINVPSDKIPPLGAIERWRDIRTGRYTRTPPEQLQTSRIAASYVLRFGVEGKRGWRDESGIDFGRQKVKIALFGSDGKLARLITNKHERITKWQLALYRQECYETIPDTRAVSFAFTGATIRDSISQLKIGGLGWGAELIVNLRLSYRTKHGTIEKLSVAHRQNFISLPLGETYDTKLRNDLARSIRQALKLRAMRFTSLAEMRRRMYNASYWREGAKPTNAVIDDIINEWEKCEQIDSMSAIINITRLRLPKESSIKKGHIQFPNQHIFYTCVDPINKKIYICKTKAQQKKIGMKVQSLTYQKGKRILHARPSFSSFFAFQWREYNLPKNLKELHYTLKRGF